MQKSKQVRQLKVYGKNHARKYSCYRELPWLNLSGVWLAKAGFNIGDGVEITIANGRLIVQNLGTAHGNPGH